MAVVFGSPIENDAEALTGGGTYQGDGGEDNNFSGLAASPVSAVPPAELRHLALTPRAAADNQAQQWRRRRRQRRPFDDSPSDSHPENGSSSSSSSATDALFGHSMDPGTAETLEESIARVLRDDGGLAQQRQQEAVTSSPPRSAPVPPLNPFAPPSSAFVLTGQQRRRMQLAGGGGTLGTSSSIGTSNSLSGFWGGNADSGGGGGIQSNGSTSPRGQYPPLGGGGAPFAAALSFASNNNNNVQESYDSMLADGNEASRGQYNLVVPATTTATAGGTNNNGSSSPIAIAQVQSSGSLRQSSGSVAVDQMAFSPSLQWASPAGSPLHRRGIAMPASPASQRRKRADAAAAMTAPVVSPANRRHPLLCIPQDVMVAIFQYSGVSLLAFRGVCRFLNDLFLLVALDHLRPYVQPTGMSWTFLRATNSVLRKEHHRRLKQNKMMHRRMVHNMRCRLHQQQVFNAMAKRNNSANSMVVAGSAHRPAGIHSGSGGGGHPAGRLWSPTNPSDHLPSPGMQQVGSLRGGSPQPAQRTSPQPQHDGGVVGRHHPLDGLAVRAEPSAVVLPAHFRDIITRRDHLSITPDHVGMAVAPQPPLTQTFSAPQRMTSSLSDHNNINAFASSMSNDIQQQDNFLLQQQQQQQQSTAANGPAAAVLTNVVHFQSTVGGSSSTTAPIRQLHHLPQHQVVGAATNANSTGRHPTNTAMAFASMLASDDDKPTSSSSFKKPLPCPDSAGGGEGWGNTGGGQENKLLDLQHRSSSSLVQRGNVQDDDEALLLASARNRRHRITREWLLEMALYRRVKYNICNALFDCVTIEKQSHAAPLILPNGTICFSRWQLVAIFVRTTEKDRTGLPLPNTSKWIKAGYLGSHSDTITSLKYDALLRCLFTSSFDGTIKRWNLRSDEQQAQFDSESEGGLFHCQASYKVTVNGAPAPNFHIFSMDLVHLKDYKLTADDRKRFEPRPTTNHTTMQSSSGGWMAERPSSAISFMSGNETHASTHSLRAGGDELQRDAASPSHHLHSHHHHAQHRTTSGTAAPITAPLHPPGSSIEVLNRGSSLLCCGSEWGAVALLHIDDTHSATLGLTAVADNRVRQVRFLNQLIFDDALPNLAAAEPALPNNDNGGAPPAAPAATTAAAAAPGNEGEANPISGNTSGSQPSSGIMSSSRYPTAQPPPPALLQQGSVMIAASTFGGLFILSHTIYRKVCEVSTSENNNSDGAAIGAVRARKGYHYFATSLSMVRLYVFQANELPISVDVPRSWWHRNPLDDDANNNGNKEEGGSGGATAPTTAPSPQHHHAHIADDATDAHPYLCKPLMLVVHRQTPCMLATLNPNYVPPSFGTSAEAIAASDVHRPVFERHLPVHMGLATCGRISPAHAFFAIALESGKIVLVSPRVVPITMQRRVYRDHPYFPNPPNAAAMRSGSDADAAGHEVAEELLSSDENAPHGAFNAVHGSSRHAGSHSYPPLYYRHPVAAPGGADDDGDDFSDDAFDTEDLAEGAPAHTVFSSGMGPASPPNRGGGVQHAFDFDDGDDAMLGSVDEEVQQTIAVLGAATQPGGVGTQDALLRSDLMRHQPLRRRSDGHGTSDNLESAGATPGPSAWSRHRRFDEANPSQANRGMVWSPVSTTAHLDDVRTFFGARVFSDALIRGWQNRALSSWDQLQMAHITNDPSTHMLHVTTLFYPSLEHVSQPIVNMDLDGWKLSVIDANATVMVFNVETLAHLFTLTMYPAPHHNIPQAASIERAIAIEGRARPANPKYVVWSNSTMLVSPLPITSHSVLVDFSGQFFDAPTASHRRRGGGGKPKQQRRRGGGADQEDVPMMPSFRPPAATTPSVDDNDAYSQGQRNLPTDPNFTNALSLGGSAHRSEVAASPRGDGFHSDHAPPAMLVGGTEPTPYELAHTKTSDSLPWLLKNIEYVASQGRDGDEAADGDGGVGGRRHHRSVLATIVPLQAHPFMFHILYIFAPPVVMLMICIMLLLMALRLDGYVGMPFAVPFALHFALLPHYFGINLYSYKPLLAHHAGTSFYFRVLADAMYLVVFPIIYVLRRDLGILCDISWVVLTLPLSLAILLAFSAARLEDAYELRHRIALDPVAARQRYKHVTALQALQTVFIIAFVVVFSIYFDDPLGENSLASMSEHWSIFVVFLPIWCFVLPYGWQIYGLVAPPAEAPTRLRRVWLVFLYVVTVLMVYVVYITVAVLPLIGFCFRYDRYHDCASHPNGYRMAHHGTQNGNSSSSSTNGSSSALPPPPLAANSTNTTTTASPMVVALAYVDVPCGSTSIPLTAIVVPILAGLLCVSAFAASNVVTHVRQLRGTGL